MVPRDEVIDQALWSTSLTLMWSGDADDGSRHLRVLITTLIKLYTVPRMMTLIVMARIPEDMALQLGQNKTSQPMPDFTASYADRISVTGSRCASTSDDIASACNTPPSEQNPKRSQAVRVPRVPSTSDDGRWRLSPHEFLLHTLHDFSFADALVSQRCNRGSAHWTRQLNTDFQAASSRTVPPEELIGRRAT